MLTRSMSHLLQKQAFLILNRIIFSINSLRDPRQGYNFSPHPHIRLGNLKGRCVKVILIENWFIIEKSHLQKLIYRSIRSTRKESYSSSPPQDPLASSLMLSGGNACNIFLFKGNSFGEEDLPGGRDWGKRASSGWANKTFVKKLQELGGNSIHLEKNWGVLKDKGKVICLRR